MKEIVRSFEDLAVFQKSRELCKNIYNTTRLGDWKYDTRFVQQIHASCGSVMDNIAEGYERNGNKEFINFLYIAKGSCGEVRSQLMRAHDVGYMTDEDYKQLYGDAKRISAAIMNLIKELKEKDLKGAKYV